MRDVPAKLAAAWSGGQYIGDKRPIARVTVQHPKMKLRNYSLMSAYSFKKNATLADVAANKNIDPTRGRKVSQCYADFLFTSGDDHAKLNKPMELPNIKSVTWSRSVDGDVAECTITMWNTAPLPIGQVPYEDELDEPGYYTYSRGGAAFTFASKRWGHKRNAWFGMMAPDNLIRTYEGYGYDPDEPPETDSNLIQTGLWIIDSVSMGTEGLMTIKCRDIGRILMDQMFFDPVVPKEFQAHEWIGWGGLFPVSPTKGKLKVKATKSSNENWLGPSGTVAGHKLSWAFDGNPNSYWLSVGNTRPNRRFAYEWVECSVGNQSVSRVRVRTKKSGYTCYISVKVGGVWQGKHKINYHEDGIGRNDGDVNYVATKHVNTESFITIDFPAIAKVQAVRVTLGNLQNFRFGTYTYRGGIRDVEVYGKTAGSKKGLTPGAAGANPGRYADYSDIIKLLCAWGGFFWPAGGQQRICDRNDFPQYITTDLGETQTVARIVLRLPVGLAKRTQTIAVAAAKDADTEFFTNVVMSKKYVFNPDSVPSNIVTITFPEIQARYLKLFFTANDQAEAAQLGSFEVYASTTAGGLDLARDQPINASTNVSGHPAINVRDGFANTYWESGSVDQFRKLSPKYFDTAVLGKGVKGRVFGDFATSTTGAAPLPIADFDKKSLMDCITTIRDTLGFLFFIDETGGVQWRMPNWFNRGCLRSTLSANPKYVVDFAHTIDERSLLLSLDATIDAKNVRESFFVGDQAGKVGAFAPGFNPNPTGLRRVGGWTDVNFSSNVTIGDTTKQNEKAAFKQCQMMADMLSLQQLFTYRTDHLKIPANPAIQIDDQIRIWERTTAEGYLHYVKSIASNLDMSTGEWTYDMETHWLGFDPKARWVFKQPQLHAVTSELIIAVNKSAGKSQGPSRIPTDN